MRILVNSLFRMAQSDVCQQLNHPLLTLLCAHFQVQPQDSATCSPMVFTGLSELPGS